ncbi:PREDICTED: uncharacterized protein LOC109475491 [Branchiostoma belcheri]|uniref:Uncharacterized protein LOC109475491 n=1 Tax=Branchiostoma belcheri TaxID=7741 RepID=A0A6P4YQF7_BRABE|nr:PREDICTED: uncharacterized protein LOC109475491 [Branchiostoma belcheri]
MSLGTCAPTSAPAMKPAASVPSPSLLPQTPHLWLERLLPLQDLRMQSVVQMLVLTTAAGCAMFAVVAGHAGPCTGLSPGRTPPVLCLKKFLPCSTSVDCPEGLTCGCSSVCGPVCRETGASFHVLKRDDEDEGSENDGSCPALPALSSWHVWSPFGCVNSCNSDSDCDEQHPDDAGRYKCCERVCGKRCVLAVRSS